MLHGALRNEVAFTFVFVKARISWLFDEEKKNFNWKKEPQHGGNLFGNLHGGIFWCNR